MGKLIDLTGRRFGRLTVKYRGENDKWGLSRWWCECDCDNKLVLINSAYLRDGTTQSCGCYNKEVVSRMKKKYNSYDLSGEYGVGLTCNKEEFYFDLEDYDKIKNYCWRIDRKGYVVSSVSDEAPVRMHRLLFNIKDDRIIDHINRNPSDNRKENLRITDNAHNRMNMSLMSTNTSGVTGVSFYKNENKWSAEIYCNNKHIHLGRFISFEDAVKARLEAEVKYYGEFAPQQHLYEQYGIDTTIG